MEYKEYKRKLEETAARAVYFSDGSDQDKIVKKADSMLEEYRKIAK